MLILDKRQILHNRTQNNKDHKKVVLKQKTNVMILRKLNFVLKEISTANQIIIKIIPKDNLSVIIFVLRIINPIRYNYDNRDP
ncbi:hypothetical protein GCM10007049_32850 [Echinicola pacifica]|uniref:Uncharacterized protein n=1 Tax=Echinicola pacifica TaxID=346377 RepID=A0A918Q7K1_9BACT|nr:hypothetical protein GCM10007049_32850 [Echinicola pacifica]